MEIRKGLEERSRVPALARKIREFVEEDVPGKRVKLGPASVTVDSGIRIIPLYRVIGVSRVEDLDGAIRIQEFIERQFGSVYRVRKYF